MPCYTDPHSRRSGLRRHGEPGQHCRVDPSLDEVIDEQLSHRAGDLRHVVPRACSHVDSDSLRVRQDFIVVPALRKAVRQTTDGYGEQHRCLADANVHGGTLHRSVPSDERKGERCCTLYFEKLLQFSALSDNCLLYLRADH